LKKIILVLAVSILANAWSVDYGPPPAGLVSWWQAESNANDAADGNNGSLINSAGFSAGRIGKAFDFNGANQYVEVPSSSNLNPAGSFSIEGWIFPRQDRAQIIMSKWADINGDRRSYNFSINPNRALVFAISDVAHQWDPTFHLFRTTNNVFAINTWTHVAAVYDQVAGARRIYVNGVKVAERIDTPITVLNSTATVLIGNVIQFALGNNCFDGLIDEWCFYSTALSTAEVQARYAAGNPIPHAAIATSQIVNGFVVGITITDPGYGYTNAPVVEIAGGGGHGATAVAQVANGMVTGITITDAGIGYTDAPDILIASPPFVPWLDIAVSQVRVTQHVVLGHKYVLESSWKMNPNSWTPVGDPFTATNEVISQVFEVEMSGRYFRIREVQ
jgi:hypothetical protein